MNKEYVLKSGNMYLYNIFMHEGLIGMIEFTTDIEQANKYELDYSLVALKNIIKEYLEIEIESVVYNDNKE